MDRAGFAGSPSILFLVQSCSAFMLMIHRVNDKGFADKILDLRRLSQ